ncbi:MAG: ABC transporter permease [Pseudomonadota bacterium]
MRHHLARYGALLGALAIVAGFALALPETFLTFRNWINISQQVSMLAVIAFTMTVVMVTGDFDLSVGSMASLSGVVAAVAFQAGAPVLLGVAAALAVGLIGGALNGLVVARLGILPFVATLATLTIFSGAAFLISDGRTIFGRDIPASFGAFARGGLPLGTWDGRPLTLPALTLVALAVFALVWLMLGRSRPGRHLYAIGSNRQAAHLAGIRVTQLRIAAFATAGLGAALGGLMYASRVASANPTQGAGLMLDAIAAVFLGMALIAEPQPRVSGTLLGVLILGVLDNGLTQLNVGSYVREVVVGLVLLAAVVSARLSTHGNPGER